MRRHKLSIRNEKSYITTAIHKSVIKGYYAQLKVNKFNNIDKMNKLSKAVNY